jgi:hypothetical protein
MKCLLLSDMSPGRCNALQILASGAKYDLQFSKKYYVLECVIKNKRYKTT